MVLTILLTSCGGDGSVDLPSPTGSNSAGPPSRTASLASPTRSVGQSESAPQSPIESSTPTSSTPTADESHPTESADSSSMPSWAWWLLGVLGLLAAVLALILVPRARRRSAWDADQAAADQETRWLARELFPQLQRAGSPDEVAGGWQVAAGRVTRLEDQLTGLESTAPDDSRGRRARAMRDAVRAARHGMETRLVARDPATLAADVTAIAAQLSATLDTPTRAG